MALPYIQLAFLALVFSAFLLGAQAQSNVRCDPESQIPIDVPNPSPGEPPQCADNPCFGVNNPCLGGGTCTPIKVTSDFGSFGFSTVCTCNPPYVAYNISLSAAGPDGNSKPQGQCLIPGADPCTPNPCLHGGTCSLTDSSPVQGFHCSCPNLKSITTIRCGYLGESASSPVTTPPPVSQPAGSQGVCGTGESAAFPTRCWFNNDPLGRYVCCDAQGCDGFNADNLTPHCANFGHVPPNYGLSGPTSPPSTPPSTPPNGDQGVCGTGDAAIFPNRCWFNSDPLGRYVCCDVKGCNGFNSDNLTPHCANFGYVPPNFGLSNSPSPPSTPPSGSQGVCGSGEAAPFPNRCWFNNDPQGRYVCCDQQGCDGFNADNLIPHCANFGYVPPGYGLG